MEDIIKSQKYKVSEFEDLFGNKEELDIDLITTISSEDSIEINLSEERFYSSVEDSGSFMRNLYRGKDVILNEKWTNTETIQGKVVHLSEQEVFVDCLIDLDNKIFQHRAFSKHLFENIFNLSANKPVIIKTRLKPGAIRVDVYSGDGIVNLELFQLNENWDNLKDSGLDVKLNEW